MSTFCVNYIFYSRENDIITYQIGHKIVKLLDQKTPGKYKITLVLISSYQC